MDEQVLAYLRLTGRDEDLIETVEQYYREQGMWREDGRDITYSANLELDLASVEPSLAGPTRPQDRVSLSGMKTGWASDLTGRFARQPAGGEQVQGAVTVLERTGVETTLDGATLTSTTATWSSPPSRHAPTPPTPT